jgi:EmrB/QacA subfamily drug resistance transporter
MVAKKTSSLPPPQNSWPLFLIVAAGVFMSTLDSSMVNVALPFIMREFNSSLNLTEWVVMVYLLTISATLLFWGHVADRIGRGHIYSMGMLIFGSASFFGSIAPTIFWLISCRFCQAIGAAMMMSNGPAIIKENFDPARLGRYLGMIGIAVSLGLMTGPTLGGFLIEYYSWRSIFFVTAPVGILFFLAARIILPRPEKKETYPSLDLPGSLFWALSISLFIAAVSQLSSTGTPITAFILYTLSLAALYLFVRHETVTETPLLPLTLFKQKFLSIAIFCALVSFAVLFSVILLMPFFLHSISRLTPIHIGLVMLAIPSAVLVVSPAAGWFADHFGDRFPATLGLLVSSASLAWLSTITIEISPLAIAIRLATLGCGQAMFLSPNSASVLARIHNDRAGITSGLLATARNLGMLLGVVFAGIVFSWIFSIKTGGMDLKDFQPQDSQSFITAFRTTLMGSAALGLCGAIASALRDQGRKRA